MEGKDYVVMTWTELKQKLEELMLALAQLTLAQKGGKA